MFAPEASASSRPFLFGIVYLTLKRIFGNCLCLLLPSYYSPLYQPFIFIYNLHIPSLFELINISKPHSRSESIMDGQYPHFPVDRNQSNCANDDIAVDITSTGPTTGSNVGDEYAQLPFHRDSDEDQSYLAIDNELPNANNGPVTAVKLDVSCVDLPHPDTFDFVEDANNDIPMNTEDLAIDNGLHTINNGPVTAVELHDSYSGLPHPETFNLVEDVEDDVAMDVEDLELGNERHTTSNGPVTAVELEHANAQLIHRETLDFAEDTNPTDPLSHRPEMSITTKSSHEIGDIPQPVERSHGLDPQTPASIPESVQASVVDSPPFSEEFISEYEYRSIVGSQDESIHHWNWFGCPVYNRSTTPPAVSLAFMQAEPKVPKGSDGLRVHSIMNRAIQYIDPVIIKLDSRNEEVLQMHGSEMVQECGEITYTHYSLHGTWMKDDFSIRRMIVPDAGTPGNSQFAIGNGLFETGPLISRTLPVRFPRKLTWKATPSKLKIQSMSTIDNIPSESNHLCTLETESRFTQKTWLAAKRIPRTSISLPAGNMGTMIKKAWCRPKTDPGSTSYSCLSIMGRLAKRTWATITCILHKSFGFPLGKVKAGIKKAWHLMNAVFTLHRLVPDVLSWLSF
ncbi:unnamed protein product [Penicillium nalgiovense]|uniref:Uncharacterized protein n=1 Tax=Penicillium nalgiovense TaxID=60175 RepID=A0A9W4HZR6_PENNA|nr:unnamed protein product [Penicillium nalgiovense]CAG7976762.1 unnamed protein product [Penicillium nalgiovense]CAG8002934.1 unnamed protein product [Penicillium nalgiovense]CAG8016253.1 unnamed protein product [Penicillium nalgiovense]CAG8037737.1 unnamed protein product [Penicillium nalgiovense]